MSDSAALPPVLTGGSSITSSKLWTAAGVMAGIVLIGRFALGWAFAGSLGEAQYWVGSILSELMEALAFVWIVARIRPGWQAAILFGVAVSLADALCFLSVGLLWGSNPQFVLPFTESVIFGMIWGAVVMTAVVVTLRGAGPSLLVTPAAVAIGLFVAIVIWNVVVGMSLRPVTDWFWLAQRFCYAAVAGVAVIAALRLLLPSAARWPIAAAADRPRAGVPTEWLALGYAVGLGAGATLLLSALRNSSREMALGGILTLLAGLVLLGGGAVLYLVLIHRLWSAIQGPGTRTAPGRAVGLLFVPFFNIYWLFQVIPGFVTDYNSYVERRGLAAPRLTSGAAVAFWVFQMAAGLPMIGFVCFVCMVYAGTVALVGFSRAVDRVRNLEPEAPGSPGDRLGLRA